MAYKRISPLPIVEGGTNATSFSTTDGVVYYDGTKLNNTGAGSSTQVLTSNGPGVAPTFQAGATSSSSIMGVGSPLAGSGSPGATFLCVTSGKTWLGLIARANNASQGLAQTIFSKAANLSKMYVYVSANASTTNTTITLNKNSSNSSLAITIPALTTGSFSNTGTSVAFAQGDLGQFECSQSATGAVSGTISILVQ